MTGRKTARRVPGLWAMVPPVWRWMSQGCTARQRLSSPIPLESAAVPRVWYAAPTMVILTLENGHNKQYEVPDGLKFNVDGQMKQAMELKPGTKVSATKVVEAPETMFTQESVVTGTMKK